MPKIRLIAGAVSATALLAAAVSFGLASAAESDTTAIVGATIFDATGQAPYIGTLVVKGDRIVAVGPKVKAPRGAKIVKADGEALLPGFIDVHTHWTANGAPAVTPAIANAYVSTGVTTSVDFNAAPESFELRRKWLASLGVAPHVSLCGRISTPGGHGADWADTATTKMIVTPAAARKAVNDIVAYKAECFGETMIDGWRYGLSPDNTSMNADAIAALVDEAHKFKLPVLAHILRTEKAVEAGRAKLDVIDHALQDLPVTDAQIATIKAGGTSYAPTLAVYDPKKPGRTPPSSAAARDRGAANWANANSSTKRFHDAGIPIALGTDAGMPGTPHGVSALREMELLVEAGLTPTAALMAGTANSAKVMGLIHDRGTIEVGKRADLVLVKGKPWESISDVRKTDRVFVDGRLVFGPGAPPLNPVVPMPAVKVGPMVADFERADGRSNLDTLVVTEPDSGLGRTVEMIDIIPRDGGGRALSMLATMAVSPAAQAAVVLPLTKGSIQPADLRAFKGVKLELRGDGPYEIALNALGGAYVAEFSGDAQWRTVEAPFTSFKKLGEQRPEFPTTGWTGDDVVEIQITAKRKGGEKTWLQLDNVSFY